MIADQGEQPRPPRAAGRHVVLAHRAECAVDAAQVGTIEDRGPETRTRDQLASLGGAPRRAPCVAHPIQTDNSEVRTTA